MNTIFPSYKSVLFVVIAFFFGPAAAGKAFFNATFTKDRVGENGFLTLHSNVPNHTYANAGILLKTAGYELIDGRDRCITNPKNGWCTFSINKDTSRVFRIRRTSSIQNSENTAITNTAGQFTIRVALNAASNNPSAVQEMTLSTVTPGRIIGYVYGWEAPIAAASIAQAGYTHVLVAFGLFSTNSPGTINIDAISGFSGSNLTSYISELHSYGIKVLLSIGGASTGIANTTVSFDQAVSLASSPAVFESTFIGSMNSLATTYGFDGFDFDIESGLYAASSFSNPSQGCSSSTYIQNCDISYLSSIINNYHATYPSQLLTLVPQIANIAATSGFSEIWGNYASLIMQTASSLEWVAFQNYNSGCAYGIDLICYPINGSDPYGLVSSTDPAVAFSTDLLANWPAVTSSGQATGFQPYISYLNPSQVVIGYVVNNNGGSSDGSPAVNNYLTVAQNAIQCLRSGASASSSNCSSYVPPANYSNIGGVFDWTINYDAVNNFQFATTMYPCVVEGNCG